MTTPGQKPEQKPAVDRQDSNPMAVVGLSIAVVALTASWLPWVGAAIAVLAIILSLVGIRGAARTGTGRGLAVTGLVIAVISLLIGGSATTCAYLSGPGARIEDAREATEAMESGDLQQ